MKFISTPLNDACIVELDRRDDQRGFFARFFCEREFAAAGLANRFVQINNSVSFRKGTLRGLHYQLVPAAEVKLVRCIRGALYDVIVDIRPDSPTYGRWFGTELSDDNRRMMYVPRGFGHAILALAEATEALYLVSDFYSPENERGLRWDDPYFGIEWPLEPIEISDKDLNWPYFDPGFHGVERLRGVK
jgi:dTDP-4-dehydrorhamnose 3,5-epimerase